MIGCNRLQRIAALASVSLIFFLLCVKYLDTTQLRTRWLVPIPENETPWSLPTETPDISSEIDNNQTDVKRRDAVVAAFKHAWAGYERDAFGCDEYRPVSGTGKNLTTDRGIGYMIIDALDTMLIMGEPLRKEYLRARHWVETELDFDRDGRYSTFEITIRVLGGLLSAYALSNNDELYLRRAQELADRLLPAFNTPHGLPIPNVNFHSEPNPNWGGEPISTAEAATLQLEFKYLTHITGKDVYWKTAEKVMDVVKKALKGENVVDGALVPINLNANSGEFYYSDIRLGSRGDSYYEYLLKQYIQTNRTEPIYREMYDRAMAAIHKNLVFKTPLNKLTYIAELEPIRSAKIQDKWKVTPKQDHLVCFLGGSLQLGVTEGLNINPEAVKRLSAAKQRDWKLGEELTRTCMATHETKTPETVESLFLGWRLSGDIKYRKWGWQVFQAIEKYCKVPKGGYSGVESVFEVPVVLLDNMETFFVGETLKYLYLLFDDSSSIPLDKYVFNTEAHPLPVFSPRANLTRTSP
ncbi:glycosyl hydrolase 47 family, partial [Rhizoctonia solani]